MKSLEKFNELAKDIQIEVNNINDEINEYVYTQAPVIVYNRLISYFSKIGNEYVGKKIEDAPEVADTLTAIRILEKLYPELNKLSN
jgi:predicted KAP-like P-loop ATPase